MIICKKNTFISSPILQKIFLEKILLFRIILLNIFLSIIPLSASSYEENVSIFLDNLMIREGGLYTLLGSKPMTEFNNTGTVEETEEDFVKSYEELKGFFIKNNMDLKSLPDYATYKEKSNANRDKMKFINRKALWENWLTKKIPISRSNYKIFSREGHFTSGIFINIPQMIYTLKKYHVEFVRLTGIEFDEITIIDTIEDPKSLFWDKVFRNHYLLGLLLGYGEKNAYLFDWAKNNSLSLNDISLLHYPELSKIEEHARAILKKKVTVQDLPIPFFVSFEIYNADRERYVKEKEEIVAFLKDKEFIPFILECLKR